MDARFGRPFCKDELLDSGFCSGWTIKEAFGTAYRSWSLHIGTAKSFSVGPKSGVRRDALPTRDL